MKEVMSKLIEAAILAPSGENSQPWRFKIVGNEIQIFNNPESDTSLYNYRQFGSLVSHGAAITNIQIAAENLNLKLSIQYFPDKSNKDFVARVVLGETTSQKNSQNLHAYLAKRCTNRKRYEKVNLTDWQLNDLLDSGSIAAHSSVKFITDETAIGKLAPLLAANEEIIFGNKYLHDFFYNHIRWTKEEDRRDSTGFLIDTLELDNKQRKGFKLFKSWPLLNILNKLVGISRLVAKDNEVNYASASAIGVISFDSPEESDYLLAGQILERIWLKVTQMGLSMQPATGVLFLNQRIKSEQTDMINPEQKNKITKAYEDISNIFSVNKKTIMMLFRIGKGGEPTARASRKPVESFILE